MEIVTSLDEAIRLAQSWSLRMFTYTPSPPGKQPALRRVSRLCQRRQLRPRRRMVHAADRTFRFADAEQTRSNNRRCFNWFQPRTPSGAMVKLVDPSDVDTMVRDNGIDPRRSSSPGCRRRRHDRRDLACYPETFVAGRSSPPALRRSLQCKRVSKHVQCPSLRPRMGGWVPRGTSREGSWPRVSVCTARDKTVIPPTRARSQAMDPNFMSAGRAVAGDYLETFRCEAWLNDAGEELVESYTSPTCAWDSAATGTRLEWRCRPVPVGGRIHRRSICEVLWSHTERRTAYEISGRITNGCADQHILN